jgi:MFS family permease
MGTAYLGAVGLAGSAAGGLAALAGGALAGWFAARELTLTLHWAAPSSAHEMTVLTFRHWEFLFAIAFALGGYVLHALSRIREGREHSERMVLRELIAEAFRSLDQLAPLLLPLGRLRDRRLKPR